MLVIFYKIFTIENACRRLSSFGRGLLTERELIVQIAKMWPGHAEVDYDSTTSENLLLLIRDAVTGDHCELKQCEMLETLERERKAGKDPMELIKVILQQPEQAGEEKD
jgi:hypothetical protein